MMRPALDFFPPLAALPFLPVRGRPKLFAAGDNAVGRLLGQPVVEARSSAAETAGLVSSWRAFADPLLTSLIEWTRLNPRQAAARVVHRLTDLRHPQRGLRT